MSLRIQQEAFVEDVMRLILFVKSQGFTVTFGEVYRTVEQQKIYVQSGRSKTMDSDHCKRLAIDLNFFKDGVLIQDREELKPIGDYWESLNPYNRWGGSWRGLIDAGKSKFKDLPHFERHCA